MSQISFAQLDTISEMPKEHSPKKAALLSAVLPSAGQFYNKKWWKAPIIYAGLGVSGYFFIENNKLFKEKKALYIETEDNLVLSDLEDARTNRDLSIVAFVAIYALQIVDASVDAHLFHFDVSDDLSINWAPTSILYTHQSQQPTLGLAMRIQF